MKRVRDYNLFTESVRNKMTPKSEKDIEDAFDDIACKIADILTEEEDFDDYYNAYEWAYDHKDIIMNKIGDEGDYSLKKIIQDILYGSSDSDYSTLWHDENESVRDLMTPKSPDELRSYYPVLIFWKLLVDGKRSKEAERYFTDEEFIKERAKELDIYPVNYPKSDWQVFWL